MTSVRAVRLWNTASGFTHALVAVVGSAKAATGTAVEDGMRSQPRHLIISRAVVWGKRMRQRPGSVGVTKMGIDYFFFFHEEEEEVDDDG